MRCIVTGGAGFIGSHLVDKLLELGHHVIIIDNFATGRISNITSAIGNGARLVNTDIRYLGEWQANFERIDVVYHLAALADIVPSITNPGAYFETNLTGTLNILECVRTHEVPKLLYTASSSCYGIPDEVPTSESSECNPVYPYAMSKMLGESLALHYGKVYGMNTISCRLFNVYGRRSRTAGTYGAVMGTFLAQKLNGLPLTVVGDGMQARDFIHVSDVASALIALTTNTSESTVYNVGTGLATSINTLAARIGGPIVNLPKRPGEPEITRANIQKILRTGYWQPSVSFEEGINDLMTNIQDWIDAPTWTKSSIEKATEDWFRFLGQS